MKQSSAWPVLLLLSYFDRHDRQFPSKQDVQRRSRGRPSLVACCLRRNAASLGTLPTLPALPANDRCRQEQPFEDTSPQRQVFSSWINHPVGELRGAS